MNNDKTTHISSYERHKDKIKQYREKNREKIKQKLQEYYVLNKSKLNAKAKDYYKTNSDKIKVKVKEYQTSNKQVITARCGNYVRRKDVRERNNEYRRKKYHNNPEFRLLNTLRCRIRKALKSNLIERKGQTRELLGCTIQEARQHIEKQFQEGMTWSNHGEWHIDHIKPCFEFDLSDIEQQKQCFHYSNLQPLWAIDNLKKGDRLDRNSILERDPL